MPENSLAKRECVPCKGGIPPLKGDPLADLLRQLDAGWQTVEEHHLEKEFAFATYRDGVAFVNTVAGIAEEQNHHPDVFLTYRKVKITLWTHKIGGLSESDFVLAAKIQEAARQ